MVFQKLLVILQHPRKELGSHCLLHKYLDKMRFEQEMDYNSDYSKWF